MTQSAWLEDIQRVDSVLISCSPPPLSPCSSEDENTVDLNDDSPPRLHHDDADTIGSTTSGKLVREISVCHDC